jgi:hypothetical protein
MLQWKTFQVALSSAFLSGDEVTLDNGKDYRQRKEVKKMVKEAPQRTGK